MTRLNVPLRELLSDPEYPALKAHLIDATGLAYYRNRDDVLADRIARRLSALGIKRCSAYLDLLRDRESGQAEMDQLVAELTIGETYFFRDPGQFELLREEILPDILRRNERSRRIRIWSAGCATGAEPYSVAILLRREMAHLLRGWDINILGTDINREFLVQAWKAEFPDWHLRDTPEEIRQSCFWSSGKRWILRPEFKEGVSFQYYNLVRYPAPSLVNNLAAFDLILCRNVMIYFSQDVIRTLVAHLFECLMEGGWLMVGQAELNTQVFTPFRPAHVKGTTVYQKTSEAREIPDSKLPVQPAAGASSPLRPVKGRVKEAARRDSAPRKQIPSSADSPGIPGPSEEILPLDEIRSLANQGNYEVAARRCRELLEERDLSPLLHFYEALILEQMGGHEGAENALRRTLYLDRTFVLAHYHLGLLAQKRGKVSQAVRSFKNVLSLLSQSGAEQTLPETEELTCGDLNELTRMQLSILGVL